MVDWEGQEAVVAVAGECYVQWSQHVWQRECLGQRHGLDQESNHDQHRRKEAV